MPIQIRCPNCNAKLNIPDKAAGRTGKCPKCQSAVLVPDLPPVAEVPAAPMMVAELLPEEPPIVTDDDVVDGEVVVDNEAVEGEVVADEPKPKRKKKKKKKKSILPAFLSKITIEDSVAKLILGGGALAMLLLGVGVFLFYTPDPTEITEDRWQPLEIPKLVRVNLPGEGERQVQQVPRTDLSIIRHTVQPEPNTVFILEYTQGSLPPELLMKRPKPGMEPTPGFDMPKMPGQDEQLDNLCDNYMANPLIFWAGKEVKREPIEWQGIKGRQLTVKLGIFRPVRLVHRVFLVRNRLVAVSAGGRGYAADQPNVQRLFESLDFLTD